MPRYNPLGSIIDGDLCGARPPQRATRFDPRWMTLFYFACGNGPYGRVAYVSRGATLWNPAIVGAATITTGTDGWCVSTGSVASDYFQALAPFTALNQGSWVFVTRLTAALTATNKSAWLVFSGAAYTYGMQTLSTGGGKVSAGWSGNTITAALPSNGAGSLCVFSFDYSTTGAATGQNLYLNGNLLVSSAVSPTVGTVLSKNIRVGGNASQGWGHPIYQLALLDRQLNANEHGYIAANPFTWAFEPTLFRNVGSVAQTPGGVRFFPAFPFGAEQSYPRRSLILPRRS